MSDVIERLSQGLKPVTPPRPAAVTAGVLFLAAGGIVAAEVWMAGVRADAAVVATRLDTVTALGGAAVLALGASWALVCLGEPGRRVAPAAALMQALGTGLILASLALGTMPEGATAVAGLALHGWNCAASLAAFALLPGVAAFLVVKRMAPVRLRDAARTAAVAAGAVGFGGITMACGWDHPVHAMVYHAAPVALLAVVGALGLARVVRW